LGLSIEESLEITEERLLLGGVEEKDEMMWRRRTR
jgi:hypothetical protein